MNNILVICGPTATGKTKLALKLAKKFNGELVSCDSRQIYKGMDIGTGKEIFNFRAVAKAAMARRRQFSIFKLENKKYGFYYKDNLKIWGLDLINPDQKFSVAEWVKFAEVVIQDIWKRGRLPIVVGGTGFYLKSLINGFETLGIKPDWKLRKRLEKLSLERLQSLLKKVNLSRWQRMNHSDQNNPRRLIRAIEISKVQNSRLRSRYSTSGFFLARKDGLCGGRPSAVFRSGCCGGQAKFKAGNSLVIGLKTDNKILFKKIDKRIKERLKNGLITEIKTLLSKGYSWDDPGFNALGYKEFKNYLEGNVFLDEAIKKWQFDEHDYARRQMVWFKKQKEIFWFDIAKKGWQNEVEKQIKIWLNDSKN